MIVHQGTADETTLEVADQLVVDYPVEMEVGDDLIKVTTPSFDHYKQLFPIAIRLGGQYGFTVRTNEYQANRRNYIIQLTKIHQTDVDSV